MFWQLFYMVKVVDDNDIALVMFWAICMPVPFYLLYLFTVGRWEIAMHVRHDPGLLDCRRRRATLWLWAQPDCGFFHRQPTFAVQQHLQPDAVLAAWAVRPGPVPVQDGICHSRHTWVWEGLICSCVLTSWQLTVDINDLESPNYGVFFTSLPYWALVTGFLGLSALMTLKLKICVSTVLAVFACKRVNCNKMETDQNYLRTVTATGCRASHEH